MTHLTTGHRQRANEFRRKRIMNSVIGIAAILIG